MKDKLEKLRRHHWWLVNKMALPAPGEEEGCTLDSRYGLYEGCRRFAADQVPMAFNKIFRRTAAREGSKMVFGWKTMKATEKRMATNFIFVAAAGRQPPLFLILKGKPTRNTDGSYNTRIPKDPMLRGEAEEYKRMGINVYWDPNFRTSHYVLVDAFGDFREWLLSIGENREVVIHYSIIYQNIVVYHFNMY